MIELPKFNCRLCGRDSGTKTCNTCRTQLRKTDQRLRHLTKRQKVLHAYKQYDIPSCACCETEHEPHLCIDHILGNGSIHRASVSDVYSDLIAKNFPPGHRILCYNCNNGRELGGQTYYCKSEEHMIARMIKKMEYNGAPLEWKGTPHALISELTLRLF